MPTPSPDPSTKIASVWITEPLPGTDGTVAWTWHLQSAFHDPDPRTRNRLAHNYAGELRKTYPGCYVAVRPGYDMPPPIGGKKLPGKLHPLAVLGRVSCACTGLQGYCFSTYAALVALLGEPHHRDLDKVNVHWGFRCRNGTIFDVYDWKEPTTPQGGYWWHIGGTAQALAAFERFTGLRTTRITHLHHRAVAS